MDDPFRAFASQHWRALDAAIASRLDEEQIDMGRAAFRWHIAELIATHAPQLAGGSAEHAGDLDAAGRELTAALTSQWDRLITSLHPEVSAGRR